MSLVAWYPLNKDFRNLGNSDFDIRPVNNSVIIESGGKIGKAATFNGNNSLLIMEGINYNKFLYDTDFSICFWVYNDDNGRSIFMGNYGLQVSEYHNQCLNIEKTAGNTLRIYWNNTSDINFSNYIIPMQEWTHITITRQNRIINLYKNGSFVDSRDINTDINLGNKYQMGIGGDGREGATVFQGKMNDFRIYNHCLSEAEVKEISKAKILHYNFDNIYGNENIIRNSHKGCLASPSTVLSNETYKGFGINYIKWGSSTGSYKENCRYYNLLQPEPDTYYTLSFWGKGNVTCVCYFYPNVPTTTDTSQGWHGTSNDGHARIFLTSEWTRYWVVWKTRSDINEIKNVLVGRILNGVGDVTSDSECYIAGVKLEKGNTATSWSPNPQDDEYDSELATTIYDISGYEHNGTLSNVAFSHNSKNGDLSGIFKTNLNSNVNFGDLGIHNWDISYGCWLYKEDWSVWEKNESILLFRCNGLVGNIVIEKHTALGLKTAIFLAERNDYAIGATMSTQYHQNGYGERTTNLSSGWHHFFVTCSENKLNCYIDGKLEFWDAGLQTYNLTNNPDGYIGKRTTEALSYSFNGLIDDVRFYATTLTADDVQRIYKERAKIDNIGNIYCSELNEEERVVEYLESTGTQWINTEVSQYDVYGYEIEFESTGIAHTNPQFQLDGIFGINNTSSDTKLWFGYNIENNTGRNSITYKTRIIYSESEQIPLENYYKKHNVRVYNNDAYYDYVKIGTYENLVNSARHNMYVFAVNSSNDPLFFSKTKIYYFKIYGENNILIRDFLPTISTEDGHIGEPCLFDTVENKYYYNQGTGTFLTNLSTSDENINLNDKGILNCRYLIEGNNVTKILQDENIVKVNEIKEN